MRRLNRIFSLHFSKFYTRCRSLSKTKRLMLHLKIEFYLLSAFLKFQSDRVGGGGGGWGVKGVVFAVV